VATLIPMHYFQSVISFQKQMHSLVGGNILPLLSGMTFPVKFFVYTYSKCQKFNNEAGKVTDLFKIVSATALNMRRL
jgi:hypothetical protein